MQSRSATISNTTQIKKISMKIGRNQACPCGSGKKLKHCCGEATKRLSMPASPPALQPPTTFSSILEQAVYYHQTGQFAQAEANYRQILQIKPDFAEIYNNLGVVLQAQDKLAAAEDCFRQVLKFKPNSAHAYNNLGNLFQAQHKLEEAKNYYRLALTIEPQFAEAHNNLGNILKNQAQFDEALIFYRRVLEIKPDFPDIYHNLGNVFSAQNQFDKAELCYRKALELKNDDAKVHNALGSIFQAQKKIEEAIACYHQALKIQPRFAAAYSNLGDAFRVQGKIKAAQSHYHQALALDPGNIGVKIHLATLLPVIMESPQSILASRKQFDENLTNLLNSDLKFNQDPHKEGGTNSFYLAYHGLNDRDLQIKLATFYKRACPALLYMAPHCEKNQAAVPHKIKIGFISKFFKNHTIGKVMRGIIAHLSREQFHVHVFFFPQPIDDISQFIQQHADSFETLPLVLELARERIATQQLDILFYADIGMDNLTYFLAFARLAPVQCVTWGHPMTTGIRNLDYFISTRDLEIETGDEHYSEQLVRLNSMLTSYYPPQLPPLLKTRRDFGLEENCHLYLCPQNLFKFHPDFDPILAEILVGDSEGQIVLVAGHYQYWTEQLKKRFSQTLPQKLIDRIHVLPRQNFTDYLNLIAIADVMLDTLHFGGGNTTYEALAIGTPIVTLPSSFLRGRTTYTCYQKMRIRDCIAENPLHYVEIALRLGTNRTYREQIKTQILAAHSVLYEDMAVVHELEQFLLSASKKANLGKHE